jgi:hypothetical protein
VVVPLRREDADHVAASLRDADPQAGAPASLGKTQLSGTSPRQNVMAIQIQRGPACMRSGAASREPTESIPIELCARLALGAGFLFWVARSECASASSPRRLIFPAPRLGVHLRSQGARLRKRFQRIARGRGSRGVGRRPIAHRGGEPGDLWLDAPPNRGTFRFGDRAVWNMEGCQSPSTSPARFRRKRSGMDRPPLSRSKRRRFMPGMLFP